MCLEIYGLDPAHFLSPPGLAWEADLLTNIEMLLMVKNVLQVEYVMLFINIWKLIINT